MELTNLHCLDLILIKMMKVSKTKKGAAAELQAAAYFMKKGFYVAKSFDPQCPFDLVITDDKGNSCLIDVKAKSIRKTTSYRCKKGEPINRSLNKKQKAMGVEIYIHDETK